MSLKVSQMEKKSTTDSGFTLIEVLIAMGIFAIGFLAVGLMQVGALTTTNSARRTTEAMSVVENQSELIMAMPFYADDNGIDDDLDGTIDNFDVMADLVNRNASNPHVRNVAGPYTVRWTVTPDVPIAAYADGVFTTGSTLTRSKGIRLWVTPDNNANDIQAVIEFAKFYRMDK